MAEPSGKASWWKFNKSNFSSQDGNEEKGRSSYQETIEMTQTSLNQQSFDVSVVSSDGWRSHHSSATLWAVAKPEIKLGASKSYQSSLNDGAKKKSTRRGNFHLFLYQIQGNNHKKEANWKSRELNFEETSAPQHFQWFESVFTQMFRCRTLKLHVVDIMVAKA